MVCKIIFQEHLCSCSLNFPQISVRFLNVFNPIQNGSLDQSASSISSSQLVLVC